MEQRTIDKITTWLEGGYDEETKQAIRELQEAGKEEALNDAFYKDLEFGTGGLRGVMGVGSNRINKYTIGMATQGLCNYLLKTFPGEQLKAAIAYDSRNNSDYFANVTADVFSANGIRVYLFESLRPTPELSFTIRKFGCHTGVVLTASHNPKEYNGYKAYWTDGAQVTPPHDENIIAEVQKINDVSAIKLERNPDLVETIGKEVDREYIETIRSLSVNPDIIRRQKDLKIVFSPIHGTGILVPEALKAFGFENVSVVEEQARPDGDFPTVSYPNPEEAAAMQLALDKGKAIDADLIMATDPDADRVGIAIKNHKGEFQLMNGNQTGTLLFYYLLEAWKSAGKITGNEYIVKTIVTTELLDTIADAYGVECFNTLTGFKYIAEIIRNLEGKKQFIVGGEESYGYLIGDAVRDKDAVASCAFIAEMAAWAKDRNQSLFDTLINIYTEHGFYKEHLISITKKGASGAAEIQQMMQNFRSNPPKMINGSPLVRIMDYGESMEKDIMNAISKPIKQPKSNVLQFFTADGTKISARPSGTEPKIKFYFSVNDTLPSADMYDEVEAILDQRIKAVMDDLKLG